MTFLKLEVREGSEGSVGGIGKSVFTFQFFTSPPGIEKIYTISKISIYYKRQWHFIQLCSLGRYRTCLVRLGSFSTNRINTEWNIHIYKRKNNRYI
jgi:hypothetical protein